MEVIATTEATVITVNCSIHPFHAVVLPRFSSRRVSTTFRKYRFFGFHSKLYRSVCSDFVAIAAGDVPPFGHIGSGKRGINGVQDNSIMHRDGRT